MSLSRESANENNETDTTDCRLGLSQYKSSATAKSTARPSCLVGIVYDISREKIC